ncbi:MAG: OmpH family outer membrane protein, partial [Pirellulales bacterium]|nr:OmpH family outer membrane protein [Pirellulales bacterium]
MDLDRVAAALGSDARILAAVKQREASLNQQLAGAKTSYENQLRETQTQLGDQPTEEQSQQLATLQQQANNQLRKVAEQARGNLEQHRAQLLLDFRNQAKQAVRQVAHEQGLTLVVTKNDAVVLLYDDAVDITSAVTKRMQTP